MALLTPTQAKGENFITGVTSFQQSDNASDPATFNAVDCSAAEVDALKSLLLALLNIHSNSTWKYVENNTGGTLAANTLVYISGYDSIHEAFYVAPATPTNPPTHVLLASIDNGAYGVAYSANATAANVNTSTASGAGALVYLNPATPGAYQFTSSAYIVGMVLIKDAAVGVISFNIAPYPNITLPLGLSSGGTGQTSAQLAMNALAGAVSSGEFLRGNGANVVMSAIQHADLPSLISSDVPVLQNVVEKVSVRGNISGAVTFNLQDGNVVTATSNGNITAMTISNPPTTGYSAALTLRLTNGGAHAIAYPSGIDWGAAGAPTLQASGLNIITFNTVDGGSTWAGFLVM